MGFVSIVSGYIKVERDLRVAVARIEALPTYAEDEWPFLPREAFGLELAKTVIQKGPIPVSYKGECVIPFGMAVKEIEGDWEAWLQKFETLFKPMGASEASVSLWITHMKPLDSHDRFFYSWRCDDWRSSGPHKWTFTGEPRSF